MELRVFSVQVDRTESSGNTQPFLDEPARQSLYCFHLSRRKTVQLEWPLESRFDAILEVSNLEPSQQLTVVSSLQQGVQLGHGVFEIPTVLQDAIIIFP